MESTVSETYGTLAKARWRTYYKTTPAATSWRLLFEHETTAFQHTRTGNTVKFRTPGMKKGLEHYSQVAFCYRKFGTENEIGCDCWSTAPTYTATADWLGEKPRKPVDMCTIMQDTFSGPASNSKRNVQGQVPPSGEGDGLGPDAIWNDEFPGSALFNGSRILGDGFAFVPVNGLACMKEVVPSEDGYAKAKVKVVDFGGTENDGYNFDVHNRLYSETMTARAFFAKLTYRLRDATNCPEIQVGHFERTSGSLDPITLAWKTICPTSETCNNAHHAPTPPRPCDCPYTLPNLATTPVYLQIEAVDRAGSPGVDLLASVGWDCDACTASNEPCEISKCGSKCQLSFFDDSPVAQALVGKIGVSGFDGHEGTYAIDLIDIGSKSPGSACP